MVKLVTLASDILSEASDPSTVSQWGGQDWCGWTVGTMRKAEDPAMQEKLLRAFGTLKDHCGGGGVEKTKVRPEGRGS
jgi:hypothetical protein